MMGLIADAADRIERLAAAAACVCMNAEVVSDPRMGHSTDCFAVSLDDIDELRSALTTFLRAGRPTP